MRSSRLLVLLLGLAFAALCPPAHGAPTPGASYGGGSVSGEVKRPLLPSTRLTLAVDADGTGARLAGLTVVPCRGAKVKSITQQVDATVPLDPAGAFRGETRSTYYLFDSDARTPRGRAAFDGAFEGAGVRGKIRVRVIYRSKGRRVRCDGTVPFELRSIADDSSEPIGPGGPDGVFYGTSTGLYRRVATPVVLWFTRGGTRLETSLNGAEVRCSNGLRRYLANLSPAARLKPDGSFAIDERFGIRFRDAITTTTVKLRGQLTQQGVRGTFEINDRVRSRRTGRVVRCRGGVTRFSAVR